MDVDDALERYARLTLEVGLNLQPGQLLAIGCMLEHAPFARAVAAKAYALGARFVDVLYNDQGVRRAQLEHAPDAGLGWSPPWLVKRLDDLGAEGGALLSVHGNSDPEFLADLDGERVARSRMRELAEANLRLTSGLSNWSVVAFPTAGWAQTVFGKPDLAALWRAVSTATRLDAPDPVAAWRAHIAELAIRASALNAHAFDALRYRGPGTDLTVGLHPESIWQTALESSRGIEHVANMPTEEVFTAPDARRVSGTVAATYPLQLNGTVVRGLRVRFENGRAVEVNADQGEQLIRAHIASDEGACRLGEVALVDKSSPVGETGLVFCDTLYDENAASHIAFGNAIVQTVSGAAALSTEERHARGINQSSLHTDFMIGSAELAVDGVSANGEETPILSEGVFVLR